MQIFRYNHKGTFRRREEGFHRKQKSAVPKEAAAAVIWLQAPEMPIAPEAPRARNEPYLTASRESGELW